MEAAQTAKRGPSASKVHLITYENLEREVQQALRAGQLAQLKGRLQDEHPANIAAVLDRLGTKPRREIFALLEDEKAAKTLHELSSKSSRQLLAGIEPARIAALLNRMPMDEAAGILIEDIPRRKDELLKLMAPAEAQEVARLIAYPKESAGHMMTEKFVRLTPEMSVAEVLEYLRTVDKEVETITDVYVLDADETLIGVASLRDVVTCPPERQMKDIMNTHLVTVTPEVDQEEVARLLSHYDYLAIPVVTADRKMLGIITVDDVIDVLVAETTEDILKFGGIEGGEIDQPYFTIPIPFAVRKRVGWLLLLFLAETLTGSVLRYFESELAQVVALSFFIPLLIGTGGNTGAQTVSTLIRGLALGEVQWRDIWRVIGKELVSGLAIGLILGVVAFGRTLLWGNGTPIAWVVGLTILAICTWANTVGSLIPMVAYKLKIDPAVVSAPLITTLVDATGLAIYLLIAKVILRL